MRRLVLAAALVACAACGTKEARLRHALSRGTGVVRLPPGVIEVSSELVIPAGAHDLQVLGAPSATLLRASANFRGRAILLVPPAHKIRLADFAIDGNRSSLERRAGLPPSDVPFSRFTENNGIIAEGVEGLSLSGLRMSNIAGYAVLVSRSSAIRIENVQVSDSGSHNPKGRNNASGGILLEEGSSDFLVLKCLLRNVRGNGIWTHSLYQSPRNRGGRILENHFENIGRDAIQVGHATRVQVERNSGARIGYPFGEVDVEGGGVPVAIDTAGNVDQSLYAGNRFEEVNGKCIDLDGFHHGQVLENTCVNHGSAEAYPHGHYGIVFNNSNPDMQSEEVVVARNRIDGAKFGGIFVIGSANKIQGNTLRRLNLAHCNESGARYGCRYYPTQPDLLRAGIYLGRGAERPAPARGNIIENNDISGYGMRERCIAAAPGVSLAYNKVEHNRCSDQ